VSVLHRLYVSMYIHIRLTVNVNVLIK